MLLAGHVVIIVFSSNLLIFIDGYNLHITLWMMEKPSANALWRAGVTTVLPSGSL
jgi:hypothetical protein